MAERIFGKDDEEAVDEGVGEEEIVKYSGVKGVDDRWFVPVREVYINVRINCGNNHKEDRILNDKSNEFLDNVLFDRLQIVLGLSEIPDDVIDY